MEILCCINIFFDFLVMGGITLILSAVMEHSFQALAKQTATHYYEFINSFMTKRNENKRFEIIKIFNLLMTLFTGEKSIQKSVPACGLSIVFQLWMHYKGRRTVECYKIRRVGRYLVSVPFKCVNKVTWAKSLFSLSFRRYHSCQGYGNHLKWDWFKGVRNMPYKLGQTAGIHSINSQGKFWCTKLSQLELEVKRDVKHITPQIVKQIELNMWPMLFLGTEIKDCVSKIQRYLV